MMAVREGGSARLLVFKAASQFVRNCISCTVLYFIKPFSATYDHTIPPPK
jgi:hypothetical protein